MMWFFFVFRHVSGPTWETTLRERRGRWKVGKREEGEQTGKGTSPALVYQSEKM